ncbi:organic cation/carnitine transporter 2-like [Ruditapes philippinarum]|uniref:organic cation/carnitine transporter 2-like n=1 Tax=Ruditapes philippinarum TaxID=129788 RepID=UPI00295BDBF3|nr:organic cation/carnitine transporter 2-like [Ruditapes philippinarum]
MGQLQLEDLLEQSGGCGRYQIILCFIVHSMKGIVCFSMLFMTFGAAKPDWWCVNDFDGLNVTYTTDMPQYKSCVAANGTSSCTKFIFDDSMSTIVTQWDLVCDKAWVTSTITSIQMAGVLVGNLACGQVADLIGRKPPLFLSLLALILLNALTAFSTTWTMFAAVRFFIGLAMGFELTVQYNLMVEFAQAKWRTWVVAVPSWAIGTLLFAMAAWLLKDWRHLHIFAAVYGIPLLASYWFVPESFRWYVGHDRIRDAENIIKKVARVNGKPAPEIFSLRNDINDTHDTDKKYTFWDLANDRQLRKYSLLLIIVWITLGLGGYGIQYGITDLSGNLFINIFLYGLISSPTQFVCVYLQNRFGRKKTAIIFYIITAVASLTVAVAYRFRDSLVRGQLTNSAAIIALIAVNTAWSPIQTLTIETYPTVVRNIGFGLQNTMARLGAVIGPQLVFLDTKIAGSLYWICAAGTIVSIFLTIPIPETFGIDLSDKIIKPLSLEEQSLQDKSEKENLTEQP